MTKDNLAPANYHGKPLLDVGGDEIEVHKFPDLQAQRQSQMTEEQRAVLVLRYPDDRPVFRRLSDWWHSCERGHVALAPDGTATTATEPEWKGHWSVVKYL
ncbi:hypothetical protein [Hoeflea alexandrii]|uniref:hypothetical protein n=1 Tax=Hoeflea alexandrii TaxID=288436 RepID=UPI0022B0654B|nr:hypothetical protein [Hoeflea alexandrii]MCZ4288177.1 hypothetical protein [Hoeflea alexandrii]